MAIFDLKAPSITDSTARGQQIGRGLFQEAELAVSREIGNRANEEATKLRQAQLVNLTQQNALRQKRAENLLKPEVQEMLMAFGDSSKPATPEMFRAIMNAGGEELWMDAQTMRLNDAKLRTEEYNQQYRTEALNALTAGKEAKEQAALLEQQNERRAQFQELIIDMLPDDMQRVDPKGFQTAVKRAMAIFELANGIDSTVDANGQPTKDNVDMATGIADLLQKLGVFPQEQQQNPDEAQMQRMSDAGQAGPPAPSNADPMENFQIYENAVDQKRIFSDMNNSMTLMLSRDLYQWDDQTLSYRLNDPDEKDEKKREEQVRVADAFNSAMARLKDRARRELNPDGTVGDLIPYGIRQPTNDEIRQVATDAGLPVKPRPGAQTAPPREQPLDADTGGGVMEGVRNTAGMIWQGAKGLGENMARQALSPGSSPEARAGKAGDTGTGASVAETPSSQPSPSGDSSFHDGEVEVLAETTLQGVEDQFGADYDPSFVAKEMARVMRRAAGRRLNRDEMDQIERALDKMFSRRDDGMTATN